MNRPDPVGWPWLRTPEATRLLQRLWPESEADLEAIQRKHFRDEQVAAYLRSEWTVPQKDMR